MNGATHLVVLDAPIEIEMKQNQMSWPNIFTVKDSIFEIPILDIQGVLAE